MLLIKILLTIIFLLTASNAIAESVVIDDAIKKIAEKASQVKITPDMLERVESLVRHIESDEYKNTMLPMRQLAKNTVDIENNPLITDNIKKQMKQQTITGDRLYVFISSSVPKSTLRNYAEDIAKIKNAVFVLRGFIGGGSQVKPTARFVNDVLKKDPLCEGAGCEMWKVELQIDPILFNRYNIKKVPAVAFAEDTHFDGYCSVNEIELSEQSNDLVVYGDSSLNYVLNYMYQETGKKGLNVLAQRLEPKTWESKTK